MKTKLISLLFVFLITNIHAAKPDWDGLYYQNKKGKFIEIEPKYSSSFPGNSEYHMTKHWNVFYTRCNIDYQSGKKAKFFYIKRSNFKKFFLKGDYKYRFLSAHKTIWANNTCIGSNVEERNLKLRSKSNNMEKYVEFTFKNSIPKGEVGIWIQKDFWFIKFVD